MVAEITETTYNVSPNLGGKILKFKGDLATSGDWIIFDDPIGCVIATDALGVALVSAYAISTDGNADIDGATATVLTAGAFTANQRPASGYILMDDEIVKYSGATKSSTTGDLTLDARGCFGTTAADHDTVFAYVLNTITFTGNAGLMRGIADVIEE